MAEALIVWLCERRMHALWRGPYGKFRPNDERGLLWLAAIVVTALAGSSVFNAVELKHAWTAHAPPGAQGDQQASRWW
jgi:hypothetical protein